MSEALFTAVAAVGVAVVTATSTLIGVHLTNRAELKRKSLELETARSSEESERRRHQAEEMYLNFTKWARALTTYHVPLLKVMNGELTYSQALDLILAKDLPRDHGFDHLQMLVDLHYRDLRERFKEVLACRDALNGVIGDHKAVYKSGDTNGEVFLQMYFAAHKNFENAAGRFQDAVAATIA